MALRSSQFYLSLRTEIRPFWSVYGFASASFNSQYLEIRLDIIQPLYVFHTVHWYEFHSYTQYQQMHL
jgi:hypothetical protein